MKITNLTLTVISTSMALYWSPLTSAKNPHGTCKIQKKQKMDMCEVQSMITVGSQFNRTCLESEGRFMTRITDEMNSVKQSITNNISRAEGNVTNEIAGVCKIIIENMKVFETALFEKLSDVLNDTISKKFEKYLMNVKSEVTQALKYDRRINEEKMKSRTDEEIKKLKNENAEKTRLLIIVTAGCILVIQLLSWCFGHPTASIHRDNRSSYRHQSQTVALAERESGYHLKWTQPAETSVCVICFHTDQEQIHVHRTKTVFESTDETLPTIHSRVVLLHSDIRDLPGCCIYMVYIDYNDRNVILEDPDKGLGSLRLTTVKSLLEFGGDVTVVYCGDRGSRELHGAMYNPLLTSIKVQPQLSGLSKRSRMLSIFKEFSDLQKQHCRDYIQEIVRRE